MKRPRKPNITTPPLDKLSCARAISHLRESRENLARASATLLSAGAGAMAAEVDAMQSGLEDLVWQIENPLARASTT
jgi:hypothetical protein